MTSNAKKRRANDSLLQSRKDGNSCEVIIYEQLRVKQKPVLIKTLLVCGNFI